MESREPSLNAVIVLNPERFKQAQTLDEEQQAGNLRGPLHGLPVLLKDNIESREMATTAGSLALGDNYTARDAELTQRLRDAGLVIAGKTNLSEWANFRDDDSTSGWSAVGGLTPNAWDQTRTACGSSSGSAVAVAAGYVPFAVGTETNGSVICPASYNGIVGIKPTVGLISRRGIVPISHTQDTAGPMAYNVKAAALLLSAMEGEDKTDEKTVQARDNFGRDYISSLSSNSLQGMRLGVIRSRSFGHGTEAVFQKAVEDLVNAGAETVEDLKFPDWPEEFWPASLNVLLYEFKHDLNAYLGSLPGEAGKMDLESLIAFNEAHAEQELNWFGQSLFHDAQAKGDLESEEYQKALQMVQSFSRTTIDDLLQEHNLDALVVPTNSLPFSIDLIHGDNFTGGTSSLSAIAGYPHITVPAGRAKGLPVGLSFIGTAFSEPALIRAAYAYEQASKHATTLQGKDPWDLEERFRKIK